MKRLLIQICFLLIMINNSQQAMAHGVTHELKLDKAAVLSCAYDDGMPMSKAKVKVYTPGNMDSEYQNGITDDHGVFAFVPDCPGKWTIIVNDGMGHLVKGVIEIRAAENSLDEPVPVPSPVPNKPGKLERAVSGLAIIWGIAGFVAFLRARKMNNNRAG